MYINQSVGLGAKNQRNDLMFVQELLNLYAAIDRRIPTLTVDGKFGKNTKNAIYNFQLFIVKLKTPDSKIDPNGRCEKTLVAKAIEIDNGLLPTLVKKYNLKKEKLAITGSGPRLINYRTNAKKVLSLYTENIVKLAMGYAGITSCDISSTLRTFDDQTRIMYDNCSAYSGATSVSTLRAARGWGYSTPGQEVEKIYYINKADGADVTKAAMKEKIESLYKESKMVSLHCVAEADFNKKNVLDIPYSSVAINKRKDFETTLMSMSQEINNARYTRPVPGEYYITRLIIEDKCWHIEILQDNKTLPNQKKPAAPVINQKYRSNSTCTANHKSYVFDFLDDWY